MKFYTYATLACTSSLCVAQYGAGNGIDFACRLGDDLRPVANVHNSDSLGHPLSGVFSLGDTTGDSVPEQLVVDMYVQPHFAAMTCGSTGDLLWSIEGTVAADYFFAVDAQEIGDADGDGTPDILLTSNSEVIIISGSTGSEIGGISYSSLSDCSTSFTYHPFSDVNKTGTVDSSDTFTVVQSATNATPIPSSDLNLDGNVNATDAAISASNLGAVSGNSIAGIASALGGTYSGITVTVNSNSNGSPGGSTSNAGVFGWFKKVWSCATCLIQCGDSYGAAWDCRNELKDKECECWDGPLQDISACLDDLRLNFMSQCIQDAAGAAGDCGQCILDCHPLAP